MKILIINGPNLNMLAFRNQDLYGSESLEDINNYLIDSSSDLGVELDFYQSNLEGEIINKIHSLCFDDYSGLVINPGAYSHYSIAIRDAIEMIEIPSIEVHLSNIYKREDFRSKSVIAPVCRGQISGLGKDSYLMAIRSIVLINSK